MTFSKSGLYLNTFKAMMLATSETGAGGLAVTLNTWKVSLLTSATVNGVAPVNYSAATAPWASTHEATGTAWVTTGYALSALNATADVVPTFGEVNTGSLQYTWTHPLSKVSTTIADFAGFIVYADPISAPVVKPMFFAVAFGASYATAAGTIGITPDPSFGLFEIDLTP